MDSPHTPLDDLDNLPEAGTPGWLDAPNLPTSDQTGSPWHIGNSAPHPTPLRISSALPEHPSMHQLPRSPYYQYSAYQPQFPPYPMYYHLPGAQTSQSMAYTPSVPLPYSPTPISRAKKRKSNATNQSVSKRRRTRQALESASADKENQPPPIPATATYCGVGPSTSPSAASVPSLEPDLAPINPAAISKATDNGG
ncbi:hypothetical protein H0H92_011882, partial [Tricholoma furcatifolium]